VTWDESQMSVGGMLALDQVLNILGYFYLFWNFDRLVKGRVQVEVEIARSWPLFRVVLGFVVI
jgi:hypothetical protein